MDSHWRNGSRWNDGSEFGIEPDWRIGIRSMVNYGIEQARGSKEPITLKFDCFNSDEADLVKELMASHPDIDFFTTRISFTSPAIS